ATAHRVTTNDANTRFLLEGNAIVVREGGRNDQGEPLPRLEFRGEYLLVELEPQERISSDQPVELLRDGDRLNGQNMDYDGETGIADFKGRVRVELLPRTTP